MASTMVVDGVSCEIETVLEKQVRNRRVDALVSQTQEEIAEVIRLIQQECIYESVDEQPVDISVQTQDHDVDVVKVIPQERISERINEQIVDVPGPEIIEEIVGVVKFVSQEREKQHVLCKLSTCWLDKSWGKPSVT